MPTLRGMFESHGLAQRKALIRYFFKSDPKTSEEFAEQWNQLYFALQFDGKIKVKEIKKG